jgi:hypothetical protein
VVSGITNGILRALAQAGLHGLSGGLMNSIEGGDFMAGFASGAMSSLISSGIEALGQTGNILEGIGADGNSFKFAELNKFGASNYYKAAMIAAGGLSGGISSVIAGGNFWKGVRQGVIVAGLNHLAHGLQKAIQNSKSIIAGIYGAGDENNPGNTDLRTVVEGKGGKMFSSHVGENDDEIIDYLKQGYNKGKAIEIYGYSRGGAAAIRITNALGEMGINVSKLFTFDPHSLTSIYINRSSYSFELKHDNVGMAVNFYQQNDVMFKSGNPFWGNKVSSNYISVVNYHYTHPSINHINIVSQTITKYNKKYGF